MRKYSAAQNGGTLKENCAYTVLKAKKRKALKILDFQGFLNGGESGVFACGEDAHALAGEPAPPPWAGHANPICFAKVGSFTHS